MAPSKDRAGLLPAILSVLLTLIAVAGSIGFLTFQAKEQQRFLAARSARCGGGATDACDALRRLCLKRDPDACVSLADAYLAPGLNRDPREGARLLGEACRYRHPEACARAGRMALEGTETPKNLAEARKLLDQGCAIGAAEACALRRSTP